MLMSLLLSIAKTGYLTIYIIAILVWDKGILLKQVTSFLALFVVLNFQTSQIVSYIDIP